MTYYNNADILTYFDVLDTARGKLKERIESNKVTDTDDHELYEIIHEVADSSVPIYDSDVFSVMASGGVSHVFNDEGLIYGLDDVIKILQVRIYEELVADLHEDATTFVMDYVDSLEEVEEDEDEDEDETVRTH